MTMTLLRPLRHPQYRRVWAGQAVSSVGDGVFTVALAGAVLNSRHASDLGYVLGADGAALVLVSLLGGVLADRLRRSRAMALSDAVRALGVLGFALGAVNGPLIGALALAALIGSGTALFQPAFGALTPFLVPAEDLGGANALRTTTGRVALVVGPGLGGLLMTLGGTHTALLFDAATFAVSIFTLVGIKDTARERTGGASVLSEAKDGLAAVWARPWVTAIILQGTVQLLFVMGPAVVLLPILLKARGLFYAYGLMVGLQSLGSVCGGLAVAAWKPKQPGTAGVCALALLGLELACLALGLPIPVLGAAMVATGFGYSVFGVLWGTSLQRSIPDELLGRVMSVEMLGTFALAPVGLALAPGAVSLLGLKPVLYTAIAVLVATTVVPLFVTGVRMFGADQAPTPADEPSAGEPSAGEPSAGEPSADEPSAGEPSADEPSADEPSAVATAGGVS